MKSPNTPLNFKEVFKLTPFHWVVYNSLIAFFKTTGLWKYPVAASGDLETMTYLDKVYWLYKTIHPMKRARRGSDLESLFETQKKHVWNLPQGFKANDELSLSAVGDLMSHSYLKNSASTLYSEIGDSLFGADVAMANLECVIYEKAAGDFSFSPKSGPPLFYDREAFDIVKGAKGKKFTFVSTACNHSLDFGNEGVGSTIKKLKDEQIHFNGVNEKESDADLATMIEKNGFKIGLISHTFGLNAYKPTKDRPRIVNRTPLNDGVKNIDFSQFEKQIASCKHHKVDFIIAQLHWGMEHEFYPLPDQVALARHLAEMGIDAVIGHHPHVVQPTEYYQTQRDPLRVVPIFYSLGNLINPCAAPYLCLSYLAHLVLARGTTKEGTARTYVKNAQVTEVYQVADDQKKQLTLTKKG